MNLSEYLADLTGYERFSFFLSGANIILNTTFCLLIEYLPLRKFLRVKPLTVVLLNALIILLNIIILLCFPEISGDSGKGQMFGLVLYFAMFIPLALFLLRDCFLQNLFIIAFSQCATQFIFGMGNYLEFRFGGVLFPDVQYEVALFSKLFIYPFFLFFSLRILGRLFKAWNNDTETKPFWKVLWLIPAALATMTAISGTVYTLTEESSMSFILSRIFSMVALIVCIIMMTDIMNIERETAAARMRADIMKTTETAYEKSRKKTLQSLAELSTDREDTIRVIKKIINCAKRKDKDEITTLLQDQMAVLDISSPIRVCENDAVNALVTYYGSLAESEGIEVIWKLNIPKETGCIPGVDLSRIIGNMLENAVEACRLMDYGAKSIRFQSKISGDMLVLGMNNSFDGNCKTRPDGSFISRKRESGIATGLNSIRSVTEKYNGSVKFEAIDRVFKTSVRLDMAGEP
jgi:hypothetical protein